MADDKKLISARQAAQAVLAKAQEVLAKSETLKKYETENYKKPGVKYGKIETAQKPTERDYNEYNVKPGSSKDSSGPRIVKQVSPSGNPKEEAEGNNKPDGMEPDYEFKNKVSKELAKEKAAHMVKKENPDEKADAKLGEKIEHEVEEHMLANKDAEKKEGHKIMKKSAGETKHDRCVEGVEQNSPDVKNPDAVCSSVGVPRGKSEESEGDKAFVPARLIASAKLSKFMEYKHAKRKAAESVPAVGEQAADAPPPRSTQAGEPEKK
jgi:hypothetical protein